MQENCGNRDHTIFNLGKYPWILYETVYCILIERRFVRLGRSGGGARVSAVEVPVREGDGAPHRIHLDCTA